MQSIKLIYINKILLKTLTLRKRGAGFDAWRHFVDWLLKNVDVLARLRYNISN